jgi:cation:H+ antiporter
LFPASPLPVGTVRLAIGSLAGSNLLNVTLILGVAALVGPVRVLSTVPRREAPLSALAVLAFTAAVLIGLSGWIGAVLAVLMAGALVLLVRFARPGKGDPYPDEVTEFLGAGPASSVSAEMVRAGLGLTGTLAGAQLLVTNASDIALRLGVPQSVIGFTLVALGTSLPELVTSIQAQRRGESDLLVGNLLGSNLFNSLAGGAIVGLASPVTPTGVGAVPLGAMVVVSLLTWGLLARGHRVTRWEAGLLLTTYLVALPLLV